MTAIKSTISIALSHCLNHTLTPTPLGTLALAPSSNLKEHFSFRFWHVLMQSSPFLLWTCAFPFKYPCEIDWQSLMLQMSMQVSGLQYSFHVRFKYTNISIHTKHSTACMVLNNVIIAYYTPKNHRLTTQPLKNMCV